MDDLSLDSRAYDLAAHDPAYVNAMLREARRMRNAVILDLVKAIFDGRLTSRLFGNDDAARHGLPKGAAQQS